MTAYLDTGVLLGLLDARDQMHQRTLELFAKLHSDRLSPLCPYPAALELHAILLRRKSIKAVRAHQVLERLLTAYPTIMPAAEDGTRARELLARFPDQKISLTDATIASMSLRARAPVLTYDRRHFGLMGAKVYD